MRLVCITNPFQRQERIVSDIPFNNSSVEVIVKDFIGKAVESKLFDFTYEQTKEAIQVSMNGLIIPSEFWNTTKPQKNDEIVFMPIIAKGESEKQILNIVILIAVIVILGPQGYGLIGPQAGLLANMAGMAIVAGTGMILQSLTPGPSMGGFSPEDWDASQVYSWNPKTTQKQGITRPRFYGKNKLHGNCIAVHTEVDSEDDKKQKLKMLIGLGSGPVQGIISGSIKINGQNSSNYSDITVEERLGNLSQAAVSFFTETKPEFRPNRKVFTATPVVYTTPDSDFSDLEIELVFSRGLYHANDQGNLANNSVEIKIEISEKDADTWSTLVQETLTDNSPSVKRKSYTASGTYTGGSAVTINNGTAYDLRITKITAERSSSKYGDDLFLSSVREILTDQFTYPKLSLLGIEALATDQLSGAIDISCIQEGAIVNVYDGAVWSLEYSTNPAWVLWDIVTQPIIDGDGSSVSPYAIVRYDGTNPNNLDLDKFLELAIFCDVLVPDGKEGEEKRITFNGGFDIGTTVWEAALKVCEIARCMPIWNGSDLTIAIDKAEDFTQMFNISDIKQGSFVEDFMPQSELISELEIQYRDEDQGFKRVPFTIENLNVPNTNKRSTLELFGVISQSEAWRAGRHRLDQNELLKSIINFDADIDAINSTIGNVIKVQQDVPEWGAGGRVISGTTLSIIVDKDMVYTSGAVHEINVRKSDDTLNKNFVTTSIYNDITGVDQGLKQFTIAGDYSDEYLSGDRIEIADSTGNDKVYTLASNAVYTASTVITVVEAITSAVVDGGLFNLRRIVVSTTFKNSSAAAEAPEAKDLYTFGVQNLNARLFRIIDLSKSSDQEINIKAVAYEPDVYLSDTLSPIIIPNEGENNPNSDDKGYVFDPLGLGGINDLIPPLIKGGPNIDVPMTTNLEWIDNSSGTGSWAAEIPANPILFTIKGITYEITPGNTTNEFIYWDEASPTIFNSTNVLDNAVSAGKWLMAVNDAGVMYPAFGRKVIHGGVIQAGTLIVDYADIQNVNIQTADIGDLQVDTLQIRGNAVTNAANAYTAADIAAGIVQSVSFTTTGRTLAIKASAVVAPVSGGGPQFIHTNLLRDSTTIYSTSMLVENIQPQFVSPMISDSPSAGTYTYKLSVTSSGGNMDLIINRYIEVTELKK